MKCVRRADGGLISELRNGRKSKARKELENIIGDHKLGFEDEFLMMGYRIGYDMAFRDIFDLITTGKNEIVN